MTSALVRAERCFIDQAAMIDTAGKEICWAQHVEDVARVAGVLRSQGVGAGDRFGILATNSVRQATLIHAGYWSGAIAVPLNTRLSPKEICQILEECAPVVLWVSSSALSLLDADELEPWRSRLILLDTPDAATPYPHYEQLLADAERIFPVESAESDTALMLYTGGTTGRGKGVPLSHRNIVSNGLQVGLALSVRSTERMLHVAPMFHSADLLGTAVTLCGGAHAFLGAASPEVFARMVESLGITYTMVPPTLLHDLLARDLLRQVDLRALRVFIVGGASVPPEWMSRAQALLDAGSMVQGYGLTETSPIIALMHYRQIEAIQRNTRALASAGRPVAGLDLKLVDGAGQEVSPGEAGEITVRGPNVMDGYFRRPEATEAVFSNGWFHTGDIGVVDDVGFLSIVDRKKDMIISGGENVYSAEVEHVLLQHPDISEVAVIGVPNERYGEAVCAVIVVRQGVDPNPEDIIKFARLHIGGYKIPRRIEFESALPRSALGKVLKGTLRERFGS